MKRPTFTDGDGSLPALLRAVPGGGAEQRVALGAAVGDGAAPLPRHAPVHRHLGLPAVRRRAPGEHLHLAQPEVFPDITLFSHPRCHND